MGTTEIRDTRELCGELFADPSLSLPRLLSSKELVEVLSATNKLRNDWVGHGGMVGPDLAKARHQQLLTEIQKLREAFAGVWDDFILIRPFNCVPRRHGLEYELEVLSGSNSEFVIEMQPMESSIFAKELYLMKRHSRRALSLLPLVQVDPPTEQRSANACYFFSRLEGNRKTARFVSHHFKSDPEISGPFAETIEIIDSLSAAAELPNL